MPGSASTAYLESTITTDTGQYVLVVIGRSSGSDYGPLHAYIANQLAQPIPTPTPQPSGSPGG